MSCPNLQSYALRFQTITPMISGQDLGYVLEKFSDAKKLKSLSINPGSMAIYKRELNDISKSIPICLS